MNYWLKTNKGYVYNCDYKELLIFLKNKGILFDIVLTDPPYNMTKNHWDKSINLVEMFELFWSVLKPKGCIVMTAQQPFTTDVINAGRENFRYDLIWNKIRTSGFLNANRMPLRSHETILVFYKELCLYNPQMYEGEKASHGKGKMTKNTNNNYGHFVQIDKVKEQGKLKFPKSIIDCKRDHMPDHPTQKPVELFEYLIKTYTNEGMLVLDPFLCSGTTGVACESLNRRWIGSELELKYCEVIKGRLYSGEIK